MKSKRTGTLLFERKKTVDRWIKEGTASAKWIDRVEIESVAKASNRLTYKIITERKYR